MEEFTEFDEALITAWVKLTGVLKNTRITQGMIYNEAVVMNIVYRKLCADGEGLTSFKEIAGETRMLKSLVNRTIDSLVAKGFLLRCDGEVDRRTSYVRPVKENLEPFLEVHRRSLALAHRAAETIGREDAEAFLRIAEKIAANDPLKN